jgi:hypothetical protein
MVFGAKKYAVATATVLLICSVPCAYAKSLSSPTVRSLKENTLRQADVVVDGPGPGSVDLPMDAESSSEPSASFDPEIVFDFQHDMSSTCAKYGDDCSNASCCDGNVCIDAPWDGYGAKSCYPSAPKCYNAGQRCAGAPGYKYVPYASCCSDFDECIIMPAMGWGKHCVTKPSASNMTILASKI